MGLKLYPETSIQSMASAIRTKNGGTGTYSVTQMASAITNLSSGQFVPLITKTITNYTNSALGGNVGSYAFYGCQQLSSVKVNPISISAYAFASCYRLTTLDLTGFGEAVVMVTLAATTAFTSTPISTYSTVAGKYGSIYVPASLLTSYKSATNWATYSNRMVGV